MDWNVIKIINIWTKLKFRQWFDMCHLTDLTRGTILPWHVAWIIFKKKNSKKFKKIQKNVELTRDTSLTPLTLY